MGKSDDARLLQLLEKFRAGTLSPEEKEAVDRWFSSLPVTEQPWYRDREDEAMQLAALWRTIHGKTQPVQPRRRFIHKYWWAAAAMLTGVLLLAVVWNAPRKPQGVATLYSPKEKAVTAPPPLRMVTASLGTVKKVVLPDSSIVVLNSGAGLQYPEQFGEGERNVSLVKGEAFFQIAKDSRHPFVVRSAGLRTAVLGTSFEISIKQGGQVAVAVATGKVMVSSDSRTALGLLLPGKKLTYKHQSGQSSIIDFDLGTVAQWRSKRIRLERASFAELADAVHTIYGIALKAGDSQVAAQAYTIALQYDTGMEDMMTVLAAIHNNDYTIRNRTVTFKTKAL